MKFAIAALALLAASACATGPDLTPTSGVPIAATTITYEGKVFNAGDHVRIRARAGTFKPKDTGNVIDVHADTGKTGIVLGAVSGANPSAPLHVALVRFDPQTWNDTSSNQSEVQLQTFEASIHASYIEKVD